jgi:hypothetical protein
VNYAKRSNEPQSAQTGVLATLRAFLRASGSSPLSSSQFFAPAESASAGNQRSSLVDFLSPFWATEGSQASTGAAMASAEPSETMTQGDQIAAPSIPGRGSTDARLPGVMSASVRSGGDATGFRPRTPQRAVPGAASGVCGRGEGSPGDVARAKLAERGLGGAELADRLGHAPHKTYSAPDSPPSTIESAGRSAGRAAPMPTDHGNCRPAAPPSRHSLRSASLRALRVTAPRPLSAGDPAPGASPAPSERPSHHHPDHAPHATTLAGSAPPSPATHNAPPSELGVRGKADAPQGGASKQSNSDSSAPRAKPQHWWRSICRVYSKPAFGPTRSLSGFSRAMASRSDAIAVGLDAPTQRLKVHPPPPTSRNTPPREQQ